MHEMLDARAWEDMDGFELEYSVAAPQPETDGSWVWAVVGERIARILQAPQMLGTAGLIAKEHWDGIQVDEILTKLK